MSYPTRLCRAAARLVIGLLVIAAVGAPIGCAVTPTAALAAPESVSTTTTPTQTDEAPTSDSGCGGFESFCSKVRGLKGPGTAIVGALCGVGLLVGGAMLGIGQQSGMRIMAFSAAAGAGILIGNGVVDVFT
jgi:hypothetical protein